MADVRHLVNRYDVITPPRMAWFRWNLVGRCRMSCRWWRKGENRK